MSIQSSNTAKVHEQPLNNNTVNYSGGKSGPDSSYSMSSAKHAQIIRIRSIRVFVIVTFFHE
jgi:hypothetical protein